MKKQRMAQAREAKFNAERTVMKKKMDVAVMKFKLAQENLENCSSRAAKTCAEYATTSRPHNSKNVPVQCGFESELQRELLLALRQSEDDSVKLFLLSLVDRIRSLTDTVKRNCMLRVLEVVMACEEAKETPPPPSSTRFSLSEEMEVCTGNSFSIALTNLYSVINGGDMY